MDREREGFFKASLQISSRRCFPTTPPRHPPPSSPPFWTHLSSASLASSSFSPPLLLLPLFPLLLLLSSYLVSLCRTVYSEPWLRCDHHGRGLHRVEQHDTLVLLPRRTYIGVVQSILMFSLGEFVIRNFLKIMATSWRDKFENYCRLFDSL